MTEIELNLHKAKKREHALFYRGIILGALLSLLGNWMVSAYFAVGKTSSEMALITFVFATVGFIYVIYSMDKKIKELQK